MDPQTFHTGMAPDLAENADAAHAVAAPLHPPVVRMAPPIVVLSDDAMLLGAVMTAALDQATVVVCASTDRFIDQLVSTTPELAVIDAAASADLPMLLDSLRQQFPQMQLLVAGPGNVQHLISRQLGDGTVFRFAHKPTSAARLKLFVDAALRERQTRITAEILNAPLSAPVSLDFALPMQTAATAAAATAAAATGTLGRVAQRPAAVVACILVAAVGGYGFLHKTPSPRAPIVTPIMRTAPDADASAQIDPEQPSNPMTAATAGLPPADRESAAAAEQAAIDQASMERSVHSEQERLAAELAAASVAHAAARSAAAVQARRDDDDSLSQQLLHDSETLLVAPKAPPQAVSLNASLPAIAIDADAASDAGSDAASDAAAAVRPVTAAKGLMDESRLHRIEFVPPHYPLDALRNGVSGEVEMNFTLTPTGEVAEPRVTSASPVGIFEASSVEAISHSRYEPVQRDGVAVAQQVHIRMRYEP
ncbi:MAG TPA: energy transducer TonB [Steroidobacteraceae bacterium]|jgi:TonB family protein|nr:energy transducer TonB [Steroidobacteraceae bacterium]